MRPTRGRRRPHPRRRKTGRRPSRGSAPSHPLATSRTRTGAGRIEEHGSPRAGAGLRELLGYRDLCYTFAITTHGPRRPGSRLDGRAFLLRPDQPAESPRSPSEGTSREQRTGRESGDEQDALPAEHPRAGRIRQIRTERVEVTNRDGIVGHDWAGGIGPMPGHDCREDEGELTCSATMSRRWNAAYEA